MIFLLLLIIVLIVWPRSRYLLMFCVALAIRCALILIGALALFLALAAIVQ